MDGERRPIMDVLDTARQRLRNRQFESDFKRRRAQEFKKAIDRLEQAEYRASFPENQNRVADLERIRAERQEVLSMMDEEFKLSESYKETVDG
jgi:uncharacterized membrane protein YccC